MRRWKLENLHTGLHIVIPECSFLRDKNITRGIETLRTELPPFPATLFSNSLHSKFKFPAGGKGKAAEGSTFSILVVLIGCRETFFFYLVWCYIENEHGLCNYVFNLIMCNWRVWRNFPRLMGGGIKSSSKQDRKSQIKPIYNTT